MTDPREIKLERARPNIWQAWVGFYFTTTLLAEGPTPLDAIRNLLDLEQRMADNNRRSLEY